MKPIRYDCKTRFIRLGKSMVSFVKADIPIRKWGNILVIGKPRNGKTALSKNMVVKISKFRKVCILDYNGEWKRHVTKCNWNSFNPDKILGVKIIDDCVFLISDFDNPNDWISLGFTSDSAEYLSRVAQAVGFHRNDIELFAELIRDLPTKEYFSYRMKEAIWSRNPEAVMDVEDFNNKYSPYGIGIEHSVAFGTKNSLLKNFNFIKDWFWQGHSDTRKVYDWVSMWKNNNHLIIDLSSGGKNSSKAMAYCGKILEKFRPYHKQTKGFFVFEEARILCPRMDNDSVQVLPSSVLQINDLVTLLPKMDVSALFVTQEEIMISRMICENYHIKIIGVCDSGSGQEYRTARGLKWNPDSNYRQFLLWHTNKQYVIFEPEFCCCRC